ncbi:YfmQ family protein [Cytobacillus firmus]|uniref:YfmQ family protein n=1 Tax=Bacillaceae TaxID=186817 RepID=UPI0025708CB8|nr:YfmQ family protein [Bacillus sp. 22-7]
MTWAVLIPIILVSLLKIVITCLPTGTVNWLLSKFETHSKLKEEDVTVTFGDKILESEEKIKFINQFNEEFLSRSTISILGTNRIFYRHRKPARP